MAQSGSAVASRAASNSSVETATKATSELSPTTASRSRTARPSTSRPSSVDIRPLPQLKPPGARASVSASPPSWRSKYSLRLLARTPSTFSFSSRPCTSSSTSGGALAMKGDSAKGAMDSALGPSSRPSSSSSSTTRSQRPAFARCSSSVWLLAPPSFKRRGLPFSRRIRSIVCSGLSPVAEVAKARKDCRSYAAERSRLQRRRTAGRLPQMSENSSSRSGQGTPARSSVSTSSQRPALAHWETRVSPSRCSTVASATERFAGRSMAFVRSPANG
mmetsp:Transcript_30813/g.98215  ORF Transcript_30813/g.98215 Transcript_30813/m.98215 type:complete len:275 (+) Transcript_30813:1127-1951(+)